MSTTTARDRLVVQQRTDAVRSWTRSEAATGSLALLDADLDRCSPLGAQLREAGIQLEIHTDYLRALIRLGAQPPDVVVISAAASSPELCRLIEALRSELSVPVLLALGPGDVESIGPAVAAGALPTVARPYVLEDLLRTLQPHWPRRSSRGERVTVGELRLDVEGYDAHLGPVGVDLTTVEFDVLALLARSPDRVVLRDTLARRLWPSASDPDGALVSTITRLRRKLARAGAPEAIHTVRGLGYRLEADGLRA